ncbi:MAG: hypothetical protein ACTTK0_09140 [Stomatobaculum sp.]
MKKYIAVILIVLACVCALSGCAEKKTFDVTQNAETSAETKTDTENKTKTDALGETSAGSEDLPEKAYVWGDISFVLTEITEDLGDMKVGSGPAVLPVPEGKWVRTVFTITEGETESGELLKLLREDGNIKLEDYAPVTTSIQGIRFDDPSDLNSASYAGVDSTMNLFFDVDESFDISSANVFVNENVAVKNEVETETTAEIGSVDGIEVVSGIIGKPEQGKMAYAPSGASGYFAVDGTLKAQSTIRICVDPNGILNYDLAMMLDSAMEVDAEIQVLKDGVQLASYAEKDLSLPAGDTVINACVDAKESAPCSGEYLVRFYINGCLVDETTGTV